MAGQGVLGFEQLTVTTAAVACTIPQGGMAPMAATLVVETQPIRFRVDGTAPTSTVGVYAPAGTSIELIDRMQVKNFRAIRDTSATANATIDATYFSYYTPA